MSTPYDRTLQVYLQEIGQTDLVTKEDEIALAARISAGDESARDHLVRANLRLVVKIAQNYVNLGLPLSDLISEGNIGLMKAVERFDPAKGGKLSTYAAWWIKQGIRRALANQSKTIRLPAHMIEKVSRMRKMMHQLTEKLGAEPTDRDLARALKVPETTIAQWKRVSLHPTSLDAPLGEDGTSVGEVVGDARNLNPYEALNKSLIHEELHEHLRQLDDRERDILSRRYGLQGRRSETLEDVGKVHQITRERVRQIQNVAIGKLRAHMKDNQDDSIDDQPVRMTL